MADNTLVIDDQMPSEVAHGQKTFNEGIHQYKGNNASYTNAHEIVDQCESGDEHEMEKGKEVFQAIAPALQSGKTHHLFISHAEEDLEWSTALVGSLEQKGFKCMWYKRDFKPGVSMVHLISDSLARCMKAVFIVTSHFLESKWCLQEIDWAVGLSVAEGGCMVIPVLLDDCDVPVVFKTLRYIDVPKGEDFIARIVSSFDPDDALQRMVASQVVFIPQTGSGLHLFIEAQKNTKSCIRGTAWSFPEPSTYQANRISQLGSEYAIDIYQKARAVLNKSAHLKYFSLGTSSGQYIQFPLCVMTIAILVHMLAGVVILNWTEDFTKTLYLNLSLWPILISIPISISTFLTRTYRQAKANLLELSLDHFKDTNILLYYWNRDSPQLQIMFYDVNPCLEFMTDSLLLQSNISCDDSKRPKTQARIDADTRLKCYLRENMSEYMSWWDASDSRKMRHPTYLNKICLCERMGF